MICYSCQHAYDCDWIRFACSEGFEIGNCLNFSAMLEYRYKRIATNEALLKLIYDYFTDNINSHSKEEAYEAITRAIKNL